MRGLTLYFENLHYPNIFAEIRILSHIHLLSVNAATFMIIELHKLDIVTCITLF